METLNCLVWSRHRAGLQKCQQRWRWHAEPWESAAAAWQKWRHRRCGTQVSGLVQICSIYYNLHEDSCQPSCWKYCQMTLKQQNPTVIQQLVKKMTLLLYLSFMYPVKLTKQVTGRSANSHTLSRQHPHFDLFIIFSPVSFQLSSAYANLARCTFFADKNDKILYYWELKYLIKCVTTYSIRSYKSCCNRIKCWQLGPCTRPS